MVANTGMGFVEVGNLNLPQLRALQRALIEKARMTGAGMFGAMLGGGGKGNSNKRELSPDQFDEWVKQKKVMLGKNVLSLQEVF